MDVQLAIKLFISLGILAAALAATAFGIINGNSLLTGIGGVLFFASIPIVKLLLRRA